MDKLERLERHKQSIERTYHRCVKEWRSLIADDLRDAKFEQAEAEQSMWAFLNAPVPRRQTTVPAAAPEQHIE